MKGGDEMTAYEIIMLFIAILSLLMNVSSQIITMFTYFNNNADCIRSRTAQKRKAHLVGKQDRRCP